MPDIGAPELIIIAIVVLVLFGSKKLPDAARSLGRSMRIFKSEIKGLQDDEAKPAAIAGAPASPAVPAAPAVPATPVVPVAATAETTADAAPVPASLLKDA